jgi:hypothetical protein
MGTNFIQWKCLPAVGISRPPARLVSDTVEGHYIYSHIGFDHRQLEVRLAERFQIVRRIGVPFIRLPIAVNNEVAFLCRLFPDTDP